MSKKKRNCKKNRIKDDTDNVDELLFDSDDDFSFIVGYTAGGVPYGLTWDEYDPSPEDDIEYSKKNGI